MIWNFSGFTKVSKMYFGLYIRLKSTYTFFSGYKCTNNINSMFKIYV